LITASGRAIAGTVANYRVRRRLRLRCCFGSCCYRYSPDTELACLGGRPAGRPSQGIILIPDFVPVLGYADDAVIVTAILRSVVRRAGLEPIRGHWPGTEDGLAAVLRLCGPAGQPDRSNRA
jgi:hypothetical protein